VVVRGVRDMAVVVALVGIENFLHNLLMLGLLIPLQWEVVVLEHPQVR
jgi:hypothetical protein